MNQSPEGCAITFANQHRYVRYYVLFLRWPNKHFMNRDIPTPLYTAAERLRNNWVMWFIETMTGCDRNERLRWVNKQPRRLVAKITLRVCFRFAFGAANGVFVCVKLHASCLAHVEFLACFSHLFCTRRSLAIYTAWCKAVFDDVLALGTSSNWRYDDVTLLVTYASNTKVLWPNVIIFCCLNIQLIF